MVDRVGEAFIPTVVRIVQGPYANVAISQRWFPRLAAQGVQHVEQGDGALMGGL
jgi:hypothetical protein